MIRQEIIDLIQKSIKKPQKENILPKFEIPEIYLEHPEQKIHGDYATSIAMWIAKLVKRDPMKIADILGSRLQVLGSRFFEKVEVKKPGFINFFLSKEYLQKQVKEILEKGEKFGQLKIGENKKTQVEFISANPTGLLHIGNGRGAFFGDCLANVLEKAGYKVFREYYINDAKANTQIRILGKTALGKGRVYLTEDLKKKIKKIKQKLKKIKNYNPSTPLLAEGRAPEGEAGYLLAKEIQKDIKNFIEKKLKIKFDNWFSEQSLYEKNKIKKIFKWLKKKDFVYQREGAWWIKTSEFGEKRDWVVIRETGEPTYFLSDIAYHKDKIERGFKKIINIWGADHQAHVPKMKAAMKILGFKGDLDLLITQIVSLKGKPKISKRKGKIVTLEELIDEISLDVARFFYLIKSLNTHMEIDLALAKEQSEKNPVYYVQYAHARICSILKKIKTQNYGSRTSIDFSLLDHPSELVLMKQLIKFPELIEDCAKDYHLQRIPKYAIDLATSFHQFYRDCKVLTEARPLRKARLGLILAAKQVIKNTLNLMGISAPDRM